MCCPSIVVCGARVLVVTATSASRPLPGTFANAVAVYIFPFSCVLRRMTSLASATGFPCAQRPRLGADSVSRPSQPDQSQPGPGTKRIVSPSVIHLLIGVLLG